MDISSPSSIGGLMAFVQLANLAILLALLILSIYGLVLFIKLARRGIKALDSYIGKNEED